MAQMHVSSAEAIMISKLGNTTRSTAASIAADMHRYMTQFRKNLICMANFHPAIIKAATAAAKG